MDPDQPLQFVAALTHTQEIFTSSQHLLDFRFNIQIVSDCIPASHRNPPSLRISKVF